MGFAAVDVLSVSGATRPTFVWGGRSTMFAHKKYTVLVTQPTFIPNRGSQARTLIILGTRCIKDKSCRAMIN